LRNKGAIAIVPVQDIDNGWNLDFGWDGRLHLLRNFVAKSMFWDVPWSGRFENKQWVLRRLFCSTPWMNAFWWMDEWRMNGGWMMNEWYVSEKDCESCFICDWCLSSRVMEWGCSLCALVWLDSCGISPYCDDPLLGGKGKRWI
jgi:hypothetical protein